MGSKASRARGGARLAGRAGRLPARGSPGPALWGSAAEAPAHCTLRPLPDYRAGPRGARAGGGGASGSGARPVSARARAAPRTAALPLPTWGPGAVPGGSLRTRHPDPHPHGLQPRGPRGSWAAAGREPVPRAWGRGRCKPVPLFLQRKAWGSDCSKGGGGAGRTQVSASPAPRPACWGGAEAGHPVRPHPCPLGSGSHSPCEAQGRHCAPGPSRSGAPGAGLPPERRRSTSCRLT